MADSVKKSFYKQWWFWALAILVLLSALEPLNEESTANKEISAQKTNINVSEQYEEAMEEGPLTIEPVKIVEPEPAKLKQINPLWPTENSNLQAIPEKDRWYNARKQIGSRGTIVGPVIDVFQATGSKGQPIFINIGKNYPDSDRAQVVIWGDRASEFADVLNKVDHGNAWVSVTGKISEYNGVVEINTDDTDTKWRTWTDNE